MKRLALTGIVVVLLSACASIGPQPQPRMLFPSAEYQALTRTGTGIVRGQAFLKTRGGDVKVSAGNAVILNPVTSYSMEWYEKSYVHGIPLVQADPRLSDYLRMQTADGSGRFTFKDVPPGEYFVTTRVMWDAPTGYKGSLQRQGGWITKRITVNDGADVEVIVTR